MTSHILLLNPTRTTDSSAARRVHHMSPVGCRLKMDLLTYAAKETVAQAMLLEEAERKMAPMPLKWIRRANKMAKSRRKYQIQIWSQRNLLLGRWKKKSIRSSKILPITRILGQQMWKYQIYKSSYTWRIKNKSSIWSRLSTTSTFVVTCKHKNHTFPKPVHPMENTPRSAQIKPKCFGCTATTRCIQATSRAW